MLGRTHECARLVTYSMRAARSFACSVMPTIFAQTRRADLPFNRQVPPLVLCDSPTGDWSRKNFAGARFLLTSLSKSTIAGSWSLLKTRSACSRPSFPQEGADAPGRKIVARAFHWDDARPLTSSPGVWPQRSPWVFSSLPAPMKQ